MTYLLSGLISLSVSLIVALISIIFLPWSRKRWITWWLEMKPSDVQGNHFNLRVVNHSGYSITNAALYITIDHEFAELMKSPVPHIRIFHTPDAVAKITECSLCWSARTPKEETPPKVDIYSNEAQPFSPFALHPDTNLIEVPSEAGWLEDKVDSNSGQKYRQSRAFLPIRKYTGKLKVVSNDTFGKSYRFEFDPMNRDTPFKLTFLKPGRAN